MGWFVGMALLTLLYKHSVYLSEHNWLPYIVLSAFAIAGGILILCIQKVCLPPVSFVEQAKECQIKLYIRISLLIGNSTTGSVTKVT